MKTFAVRASIFLVSMLTMSLWVAQGRDAVRTGGGPAGPAGSPAPSAAGAERRPSAATGTATPSMANTLNPTMIANQPNIQGTSFHTINAYYSWNNYYSYLSSHFDINPVYFDRFYRNTEPLITPGMLKLTLREPIRLSSEMLDSIDQLQGMFGSDISGSQMNKQALTEKSRQIREIAKRIRRNQSLSHLDLRQDQKLYSPGSKDVLNPEAMQKLRGMATDLDRQLRDMYRQSSTSTVSVDSYKEPSLESLTKGIERICKEIEAQSKKL